MKKFSCFLISILLWNFSAAQKWVSLGKGVTKAPVVSAPRVTSPVKGLDIRGLHYAPQIPVSAVKAPYLPGTPVSPVSMPKVETIKVHPQKIEEAVKAQMPVFAPQISAATIASSVRNGVPAMLGASRLVKAIFLVQPAVARSPLFKNEFLTLALERDAILSPVQVEEVLKFYRMDIEKYLNSFDALKSFAAFPEMMESTQIFAALGVITDVSGLGFLGSKADAKQALKVYQAAQDTLLEPIAFMACGRALLSLKAYEELNQLFAQAKPSTTREQLLNFVQEERIPVGPVQATENSFLETDYSVLYPLYASVSQIGARNLYFSKEATRSYLALSPRIGGAKPKPAARKKERTPARPTPVSEPVSLPENEPAPQVAAEKEPYVAPQVVKVEPAPTPEGDYNPVVPVLETEPRANLVSKQYPSGLRDEQRLIHDWLEYFRNGYFHPRDQVEAIEGMSASKANNVMEYLYYMPLEEAEKVILTPLRETGRLPDFMYDARLIEGTRRLPAGYYKNKFNQNVKRFVELAEEDGSIYTHNVELKDLATAMADYSFKQGFRYTNDALMTNGLRNNWRELVAEINRPGLKGNRARVNELWRKPVDLGGGKTVSLKEYFTQTRPTAFFKDGRMPEFFLNSEKWVAWENERRNLAAEEFINTTPAPQYTWWDKVQNFFALGDKSRYLTLEQFGDVMVGQYQGSAGSAVRAEKKASDTASVLGEDEGPSSLTVKINNFDKVGGVCQMAFTDGGYMGKVSAGYDGTSTVSRFEPVVCSKVPVVTFDLETLKPRVVELETVPYVKDLKTPDVDQVRASTMVGDGLDPTRDLLRVEQAEASLLNIPHLKATLYPQTRLVGYSQVPAYLNGGGLAGYLTLFTPDFYPLKTVYRLRFNGWKPYLEPQYYIRKEVPALAGAIHRDRLTFTEQVQDRIVPQTAPSSEPEVAADAAHTTYPDHK